MTVFEKLEKRLESEFKIQIRKGSARRLYPGYWQRRKGAYVWTMELINGSNIGSFITASECLRAKSLSIDKDGCVYD